MEITNIKIQDDWTFFKNKIHIVECQYKDKHNDFTEVDSCWFNFDSAVERKRKLLNLINNKDKFEYVENYFKKDEDSFLKEMAFGIKKLEILEDVKIETHLVR